MATPRFDPSHSVEFDLGRGQIAVRGGSERVLIPADALVALCEGSDPEVRRDFARRVGTEAGRRTAERLGDPARANIEAVVEHLGGDLALMGFGSLALERWGRALVLVVSGSPFGTAGDELLACVLEGALQRAFGRDVGAVRLIRDDARVRFLVSSRSGSARVREWLSAGVPWGEALAWLDAGRGRGDS
jgi:hypothetical protein